MLGRNVYEAPRRLPPVALGTTCISLGDSESGGYGDGTLVNPIEAFRAVHNASFTPPTTWVIHGEGGRSLAGTRAYYDLRAERTSATFVYFQESGDQDEDGQRTLEEFDGTLDAFLAAIALNSPAARVLLATAFNFGRDGEPFRNWNSRNTKLIERAHRRGPGQQIFIAQVARNINALIALLGSHDDVYFDAEEDNSFHYKNLGNAMVALSKFQALRYPMAGLNFSSWLPTITTNQLAAGLTVIAQNPY